jgi:hypothetical protein
VSAIVGLAATLQVGPERLLKPPISRITPEIQGISARENVFGRACELM